MSLIQHHRGGTVATVFFFQNLSRTIKIERVGLIATVSSLQLLHNYRVPRTRLVMRLGPAADCYSLLDSIGSVAILAARRRRWWSKRPYTSRRLQSLPGSCVPNCRDRDLSCKKSGGLARHQQIRIVDGPNQDRFHLEIVFLKFLI
jgi:hypothetical protein